MSKYLDDIVKNSKYQEGTVLIYIGGNYSANNAHNEEVHGRSFSKGKHYIISKKTIIDYKLDENDSDYGMEVLYFEKHGFGCYSDFADRNFVILTDFRNNVLNNILK